MTVVDFEEFARHGAAAQAQLDEPFVPCFPTLDRVVGVFAPISYAGRRGGSSL